MLRNGGTTRAALTVPAAVDTGTKIKDEATSVERRSKWDGGKLVTESPGLGPGKIAETYAVDLERHQLSVTMQMETRVGDTGSPSTECTTSSRAE